MVRRRLRSEVAEIAARTSPHDTLLVCDAMTGQDAGAKSERLLRELSKMGSSGYLIVCKEDSPVTQDAAQRAEKEVDYALGMLTVDYYSKKIRNLSEARSHLLAFIAEAVAKVRNE